MSKKIFIKTFGCQMNEYDSNRILDLAETIGYKKTKNISESDCYILNTCHIREKATEKVYHDVGRLKKEFRNKKKPILLITGCVAQAEGDEMLKREKYIDGIIGPQSYHEIPEVIKKIEIKKNKINITDFDVIDKFDRLNLIKNTNSKISSFLTIQEGCDKFCHFCVVPYTRGPEHSRSFKEVMVEAKQLIDNGAKEITLLGQNVNAYSFDKYRLSDLIFGLENLKGLERIRYTTSHPKDMTNELFLAHENSKKLMPVLHLPVQSGSSKILKLMNRKHDVEEYLSIIEKLKRVKPEIKFSSDFIIGYPGETREDFEATISLMKKIKFINSYSFLYSARPGTTAYNLDCIDNKIIKKRLLEFQNISDEIKTQYRKSLVNTTQNVLFENKLKDQNKYFGRDRYLNSVIVSSRNDLSGRSLNIKIEDFNHNTLFGKIDKTKLVVAAA
ncbi:tRNA (N6-isopentenyl adenosine(37)-C2)-methylthiotransferase MiaB [Pelagibacteraceae bacterium]|nr:tRNA (N6-isopentenyl adenosine(37)-C2)-methylthiotransferase MiaB [Pelagibacteraceae bacterium]